MDKKIPGGVLFKAADALCRKWNLYYPDAVRMASVVLSVGQQRQPAPTRAPAGVGELIEDWESDLAEDRRDGVSEVAIRVQEIHLDQLRTLAQQPAAARVDVRKLVALAEQWERYADGCRPYGFIKEAELLEHCSQCIRQTLGVSASESSFVLPGHDPLVKKLLSIAIKDKEQERTTARAEQAAAVCTCPHQDAREPYHDVACPVRLDQQGGEVT